MSLKALMDATIWLADVDASCVSNQVGVPWSCAVLDRTTFCSGGNREVRGGIHDSGLDVAAFVDDDEALGALLHSVQGANANVGTVTVDGTDGAVAYTGRRLLQSVGRSGRMGDLLGQQLGFRQNASMVRGQLLLPKQTITGNVTGTGRQLGDVAAGERLYVAVHVFTDNGTSCNVIVESDDNSGFTSAITRATVAVTGVGAQWVADASAVTDTWWRVRIANVVGTSFVLAVVVGIDR